MDQFSERDRSTSPRESYIPQRITLEEALDRVLVIAGAIEREFRGVHSREIDFLRADDTGLGDFQLLRAFFSSQKLCQSDPCLARYDVGHRLVRNFLERGDYWADFTPAERHKTFDAVLGRIHYNPPQREYEFRLQLIDGFLGTPFEARIDQDLTRMRDDVWKICDGAMKYIDWNSYLDSIANPASELFMWFHVNDIGDVPVRLRDMRPAVERGTQLPEEGDISYAGPAYL